MKIYTYHHYNEWESNRSMEEVNTFYPDTKDGRKKLLKAVKEDIENGRVELIGDIGFLNLDISCGNIRNANKRMFHGYINVLEEA